jgi:hypothetical protein
MRLYYRVFLIYDETRGAKGELEELVAFMIFIFPTVYGLLPV